MVRAQPCAPASSGIDDRVGAEHSADWIWAGHATQAADDFAAGHGGYAPVLVFADATGAFNNDTECVNGRRGNAADHLVNDVVPYVTSNFRVGDDRSQWGVAGWSMGGTCALDLTVMHPETFSAFVDIAGDASPNTGDQKHTIATLFGGDEAAWSRFDPATVINHHGRYGSLAGWFDIPGGMKHRLLTAAGIGSVSDGPHDGIANPEGKTSRPMRCVGWPVPMASAAPSPRSPEGMTGLSPHKLSTPHCPGWRAAWVCRRQRGSRCPA